MGRRLAWATALSIVVVLIAPVVVSACILSTLLRSSLLILGVCAPLIVLLDAFLVIASAVSFMVDQVICGFYITLFFLCLLYL